MMRGRWIIAKIKRVRVLGFWRMETTEAILLRKRKFSDTSLIVSWCTESFGCVQTVAKGERDHREPELFGLLRRAFGYLDANDPTPRAIAHFESELARIAGVHGTKSVGDAVSVPREAVSFPYSAAYALGNLFGRLPLSRTPLLKTLAAEAKNSSR